MLVKACRLIASSLSTSYQTLSFPMPINICVFISMCMCVCVISLWVLYVYDFKKTRVPFIFHSRMHNFYDIHYGLRKTERKTKRRNEMKKRIVKTWWCDTRCSHNRYFHIQKNSHRSQERKIARQNRFDVILLNKAYIKCNSDRFDFTTFYVGYASIGEKHICLPFIRFDLILCAPFLS